MVKIRASYVEKKRRKFLIKEYEQTLNVTNQFIFMSDCIFDNITSIIPHQETTH